MLGILGLAAGYTYTILLGHGDAMETQQKLMYLLGPGAAGYMLPKYWVTKRLQQRQEEITNGFPDSLDMMLVCVEAGLGIEAGMDRFAAFVVGLR